VSSLASSLPSLLESPVDERPSHVSDAISNPGRERHLEPFGVQYRRAGGRPRVRCDPDHGHVPIEIGPFWLNHPGLTELLSVEPVGLDRAQDGLTTAVWRYFEQVALDVEGTRRAITQQSQRHLAELDSQRGQAENELAHAESALGRIEGDYIDGRINADQWARLEARLRGEIEAARNQAEQHLRQHQAITATMAKFDAEAALLEELASIRRLVAGEAQAGSRDGLESFRLALRKLFVGFELTSPTKPMGSGILSGRGEVWAPAEDASSLGADGGYALLPYLRADAVDYGADDFADGFPAVRRAALSFSDNFQSFLAAW
jgi:hypothetical protein